VSGIGDDEQEAADLTRMEITYEEPRPAKPEPVAVAGSLREEEPVGAEELCSVAEELWG